MDPGKAGKGTTLPRNEDLHAVAGKVVSLTNAYVLACFLPPKSLPPSRHPLTEGFDALRTVSNLVPRPTLSLSSICGPGKGPSCVDESGRLRSGDQ